jgi:uncharacterized membrane protein YhhN
LKGCAGLCFVTIGAIGCFLGEISDVGILIFVGLCLGVIGDELIALCQVLPEHDSLAFVGGGSFFLIGHFFYIIAIILVGKIKWIVVAASFLIMAALSLIYERRSKFLANKMKIPLVLYLIIVIFFASVSVGLFAERLTHGAGLLALGGMLFVLSDNVLFAYKFGKNPRFEQNVVLHVAYYLAQLLIAFSIGRI